MTQLVGILNVTPDSFSDGGQYLDPTKAITHARQLFQDGASLIDIGAESTRPNAIALTDQEEWQRLEPILHALLPLYPGKISLDSYHPTTIRKAFAIGPVIVNDVSGMNNPEMISTVVELQATCIISHLPAMGIQEAHQHVPITSGSQVAEDLLAKARLLIDKGLPKEHIILDPGIGFGKTLEVNIQLLRVAEELPDYKVMVGYSRKRFLGEQRMELQPNLEAGRVAIASGAEYLRVHDVAGHMQLLQ